LLWLDVRHWQSGVSEDGRRIWHDEACQAKQQRSRAWYGERGLDPMGVAAYDLAGNPRWRRFSGANVRVWAPGGRLVYIDVGDHGKRRTHVLELATGRSIRVLPYRRLSLLDR